MHDTFLQIWYEHIKRDGSDQLLNWLCKSDFFSAPASTRFHGAYEGGLVEHSVNVYHRLKQLVEAVLEPEKRPSDETIAIVSLLHDLCKVNFYSVEMRNRKNEKTGQWEQYPFYVVDDRLPYGHGEKSVYVISSFMKLSREEAMAIRWHMGAWQEGEALTAGNAFERYPLAVLTHQADMLATYLDESHI